MASEDSDEVGPGFPVIHRLRELSDLDQAGTRKVPSRLDYLHAPRERLEVATLRGLERKPPEERNDPLHQVRPLVYVVLEEVLTVVVAAAVEEDPSHSEEASELLQTCTASLALYHNEAMYHLVAGSVADAARAGWTAARIRWRSILLRRRNRRPNRS
jgi:hypothetical protein